MKNIVVVLVFVLSSAMVQAQAEKTNQRAEKPALSQKANTSNEGAKAEEKTPKSSLMEATKNEIDEKSERKPSPKLMEKVSSPNRSKKETENK